MPTLAHPVALHAVQVRTSQLQLPSAPQTCRSRGRSKLEQSSTERPLQVTLRFLKPGPQSSLHGLQAPRTHKQPEKSLHSRSRLGPWPGQSARLSDAQVTVRLCVPVPHVETQMLHVPTCHAQVSVLLQLVSASGLIRPIQSSSDPLGQKTRRVMDPRPHPAEHEDHVE